MSMRPPASRRVRAPAIALASPAIVQSGPGGLWILPWCGKRGRCVRRRLNRRRERVYHTTWTAQTPPTEPTGIVVLALVHEITRTTSMIRCDTDATSLRSPLQQHTPFLRGVSFRCRRGVNSGCRLTVVLARASRRRRAPVNGDAGAGGLHGLARSGFDAVRVARRRVDRRDGTADRPYWSGQTQNRSARARSRCPRRSSRGGDATALRRAPTGGARGEISPSEAIGCRGVLEVGQRVVRPAQGKCRGRFPRAVAHWGAIRPDQAFRHPQCR